MPRFIAPEKREAGLGVGICKYKWVDTISGESLFWEGVERMHIKQEGHTLCIDGVGSRVWLHPISKELHREEGPAVEMTSGFKAWYIDGQLKGVQYSRPSELLQTEDFDSIF